MTTETRGGLRRRLGRTTHGTAAPQRQQLQPQQIRERRGPVLARRPIGAGPGPQLTASARVPEVATQVEPEPPAGVRMRVRMAAGARMLRRSYSYDAGPDDRGLLFLAFMRDPALFARVQRRMAATDDLNRFTERRGSAVAYVLPGALPGEELGAHLLA